MKDRLREILVELGPCCRMDGRLDLCFELAGLIREVQVGDGVLDDETVGLLLQASRVMLLYVVHDCRFYNDLKGLIDGTD